MASRELGHDGHAQAGGVKHQMKLRCQPSAGVGQSTRVSICYNFPYSFKGAPPARHRGADLGLWTRGHAESPRITMMRSGLDQLEPMRVQTGHTPFRRRQASRRFLHQACLRSRRPASAPTPTYPAAPPGRCALRRPPE